MRKRLAMLLPLLALLALLAIPAAAEEVLSVKAYATTGYSAADRPMLAPFADEATAAIAARNAKSLTITADNWTAEGLIYRTRRRSQRGLVSAYAVLSEEEPVGTDVIFASETTLTFDFSGNRMELDDFQALHFGLQLEGDGVYAVSVALATERMTAETDLLAPGNESGGWNLVAVDLAEVSGRLQTMRLTVRFDGQSLPDTLAVAQPYAVAKRPEGFSNLERYATDGFTSAYGEISMKTGVIRPDENGRMYLSGVLIPEKALRIGSEGYFEIRLSGVASGNVMLGVLYAGSSEEQRVYGKKVSLNASDGVYTIPVAVYDTIYSYSLQFDNLKCDGAFRLESVRVYSGGVPPVSGNSWIGSVSSLVRTGNEVKFSGVMEREAVTRFAGQRIRFCALPGWQADDLSAAVELGSAKVTTRFEYTAELSQAPVSGDTVMFFAAISDEDGSYLPLSRPRYPDAPAQEPETASVMGLYNAAPVGAFESNVSHVIVDVPLDTLLGGAESGGKSSAVTSSYTVYAGAETRTEKLEFSRSLLTELDRDIEFYQSAGVRVYLRLFSRTPVAGLTYGEQSAADSYAVSFEEPENRFRYAAVVRFLAERYPETAGFILGTGVNDAGKIGCSALSDPAGYAVELADVCRLTYNAAAPYAKHVTVAIPFVKERESDGEGTSWISDRTLAVMLVNRLRDVGNVPWTFLYCTDRADDPLTSPQSLAKLLSDLELSGPASSMYFCELTKAELTAGYRRQTEEARQEGGALTYPDYVASVFGAFWEACKQNRARAAFFSLNGTSLYNDRDFYSILKKSVEAGGAVYESRAEEAEIQGTDGWLGSYTVWDFSDKHYPLEWIAGGGAASCVTEASGLFGSRVLRTAFEVQRDGCAGITLCNLRNTVDLSAADALEATFALIRNGGEAAEDGGVTVVVVIGTEEFRAEYYADSLRCGEVHTLSCDLSKYASRSVTDYVGVMVYADSAVELELSSVTVRSSVTTDDGLRLLFEPEEQTEPIEPDYLLLGILCSVIAALSVGVFAILNRRERDEEESRAALETERLKTGRRRI